MDEHDLKRLAYLEREAKVRKLNTNAMANLKRLREQRKQETEAEIRSWYDKYIK